MCGWDARGRTHVSCSPACDQNKGLGELVLHFVFYLPFRGWHTLQFDWVRKSTVDVETLSLRLGLGWVLRVDESTVWLCIFSHGPLRFLLFFHASDKSFGQGNWLNCWTLSLIIGEVAPANLFDSALTSSRSGLSSIWFFFWGNDDNINVH